MKRGSIVMFRHGLAAEADDDRQVGLVTSLSTADSFSHREQGPTTPIAWVLWPGRRWPVALRRTQLEVLSE